MSHIENNENKASKIRNNLKHLPVIIYQDFKCFREKNRDTTTGE